ncbi:MAG TPA: leucyl aminopeptidase [Solirubrobacteraceae bacterium]|nr:leucyl aminopeptidase [Solirubrobacteraceae bacterium]
MILTATTGDPQSTDADTVAVALFDGAQAPAGVPGEVAELLERGEARGSFKALAVTHAQGKRWLTVGVGKREDFTPERARVAAAKALERAKEISTHTLCWLLPTGTGGEVAAALVEGTALADYSFERYKSVPKQDGEDASKEPPKHLEKLVVASSDPGGAAQPQDAIQLERIVAEAATVSAAVNEARDLQNRAGNDLTPTTLAEHAQALGEEIEGLTVEVEGSQGLKDRGMGAFAAVAQGSEQEPALITMRYAHPDAQGPLLGLVGKAVTFDSGGISIKPGAKMSEMKFDMSGGAAVIQAVAAIARLRLPLKLVAVVGATENLPSGRAIKPGDIVTAANGKTIEVNNTDAEGRLVLADCLCHAVAQGAERIVDLATLTGAVIIALGSTYAGIMSNDEEWAHEVSAAGERTGEILWRLPLHEEYDELIKGRYGDLDNAPEARKAGTIVGAAFLANFVAEVPWAHLDIAGSAWDLGRAYAPKGAAGYGVRLLVELARAQRA